MTAFEDHITVATPEGVDLELVLAGLGSRFAAALLDFVLQIGTIIALLIVLSPAFDNGYVVALFFVLMFLVLFAYDIVLETWNRGRTVGKLAAGLRVARLGGEPVGFLVSSVRNVIRIVDFLPVFYPVGTITILVTRNNQRLGDLAAGTIVVRERRAVASPSQPYMPTAQSVPSTASTPETFSTLSREWNLSAVTADDVATIRVFLERRFTLVPAARERLARDLAARITPKIIGATEGWPAELLLETVVTTKASSSGAG